MLDPDPESINPDQKHFFQYIFVKNVLLSQFIASKKEESVVDSELETKSYRTVNSLIIFAHIGFGSKKKIKHWVQIKVLEARIKNRSSQSSIFQ
jgi:hypothetical protein